MTTTAVARVATETSLPEGFKKCRICRRTQLVSCFTLYAANRDGLKHECKKCVAKRCRELQAEPGRREKQRKRCEVWRKQNPEHVKQLRRAWYAKNRDKVTAQKREQRIVAERLKAQGGGCAVCHVKPKKGAKRFPVDHCHKTNQVRGILCNSCNRALGWLNDEPARIRRLAAYVEKHGGKLA